MSARQITVPRAQASRQAARSTCDGAGLITVATDDGPQHYACIGCRWCASSTPITLPADPFARLPKTDDEEW